MTLKRGDKLDAQALATELQEASSARQLQKSQRIQTPLAGEELADAQARLVKDFCGLFNDGHAQALLDAVSGQITRAKQGQLSTDLSEGALAETFARVVGQINGVADITNLIRENQGDIANIDLSHLDPKTLQPLTRYLEAIVPGTADILKQLPAAIENLVEGLSAIGLTPEVIQSNTRTAAAAHCLKTVGKTDALTECYLDQSSEPFLNPEAAAALRKATEGTPMARLWTDRTRADASETGVQRR